MKYNKGHARCNAAGLKFLTEKSVSVAEINSEMQKASKGKFCSFCELPAWWKSTQRPQTPKTLKKQIWFRRPHFLRICIAVVHPYRMKKICFSNLSSMQTKHRSDP